jgi:putative flippase GtrA
MTSSSPPSDDAETRPSETRSFARFLLVGIANTVASYGLFVALELVLPYLIAYAIAYVAGIGLSYLLNTRIVFRVARSWSTFLRFPLVYVFQFVLGSAVIVLLVEWLAIAPRVAALVALAVTVPVTYFAAKLVLHGRSARRR